MNRFNYSAVYRHEIDSRKMPVRMTTWDKILRNPDPAIQATIALATIGALLISSGVGLLRRRGP